jgi:hypothetical protein
VKKIPPSPLSQPIKGQKGVIIVFSSLLPFHSYCDSCTSRTTELTTSAICMNNIERDEEIPLGKQIFVI